LARCKKEDRNSKKVKARRVRKSFGQKKLLQRGETSLSGLQLGRILGGGDGRIKQMKQQVGEKYLSGREPFRLLKRKGRNKKASPKARIFGGVRPWGAGGEEKGTRDVRLKISGP